MVLKSEERVNLPGWAVMVDLVSFPEAVRVAMAIALRAGLVIAADLVRADLEAVLKIDLGLGL
jgi:hypothetical protein